MTGGEFGDFRERERELESERARERGRGREICARKQKGTKRGARVHDLSEPCGQRAGGILIGTYTCMKQRVCQTVAMPFKLKSILRQKKIY
jgi:hypothetical protein